MKQKTLVLVIVLLVITGAFYYFSPKNRAVIRDGNDDQLVNDTSGWQTYKNSEHGFEFKYPADWFLEDCSNNTSYNLNLMLDKSKPDCSIDKGGRINIVTYNNQSSYFYKYYDDYKINYLDIGGKNLKQVSGYYEIKSPEGKKLSSEPLEKFILTYMPHDYQDVVFSYGELYALKKVDYNSGLNIEPDYSQVYNDLISSLHFGK